MKNQKAHVAMDLQELKYEKMPSKFVVHLITTYHMLSNFRMAKLLKIMVSLMSWHLTVFEILLPKYFKIIFSKIASFENFYIYRTPRVPTDIRK